MQGLRDWFADVEDLTVLNVVVEDAFAQSATIDSANAWRDEFGLRWEVLADEDRQWIGVWADRADPVFIQHSYTLIDRDGTIVWFSRGQEDDTLNEIDEQVAALP